MPDQSTTAVQCPYPGLRAFHTVEQDWYFGRESHVNDALTRLEDSRFLAIVGSSGSGKSSLVFAGLIPALLDGELAGTRHDEAGNPAPWSIIALRPGNAPLEELAKAIAGNATGGPAQDPLLPDYIRGSLHSGDLGLIEALQIAGHLEPGREVLVYVDQFEELFRFGERSSIAEQENAQRFSRLLVAAAGQQEARIHLLLSMRSEFIGDCDRFPGLPELVSRSQFLTPRLTRKQLEQSLGLPATTQGWKVAPDALNAVLNDCGNSPDQLPLAQHVLRRMWMRADAEGRTELTLDDYRATGGIRDSLALHGQEILDALPQPDGTRVARQLFMALCDQRDNGPLIRRLATRQEIEAIAGPLAPLVAQVIHAFGGDDPGFIREDKGWLDVRHEAVLRQWPLIARWREQEAASLTRLRNLAEASVEYSKSRSDSFLWGGSKLQRALEWVESEQPGNAWAGRHMEVDWQTCTEFLERSVEKRRLRKIRGVGTIVLVATLAAGTFIAVIWGWRKSVHAQKEIKATLKQLETSQSDLVAATTGLSDTMDRLTPPLIENANKSLNSLRDKKTQLANAVERSSGHSLPPDIGLIQAVKDAEEKARESIALIANLRDALAATLRIPALNRYEMKEREEELSISLLSLNAELEQLNAPAEALPLLRSAIEARTSDARRKLQSFTETPAAEKVQRDRLVLAATAQLSAIETLAEAAQAMGLKEKDLSGLGAAHAELESELASAKGAAESPAETVSNWSPADSLARLDHQDPEKRITCVRFVPAMAGRPLLLASSGEDKSIRFWKTDGTFVARWDTSSAVNDIEVNRQGDALAAASNGSTVRVLRLDSSLAGGKITADAFERHSDSISDVDFDPSGKFIASASGDRTVRIFDATTLEETYASKRLPGIVTSVEFSQAGPLLVVSGSDDGGVRLHSPNLNGESFIFVPKMGAPARRSTFSQDARWIAAASGDRYVRFWENHGQFRLKQAFEHLAPVSQATFRPNPRPGTCPMVTCCSNGEVRVWSHAPEGGPGTGLAPSHSGAVVSASWNADGSLLATVGGGEVILWTWPSEQDLPRAVCRISGLGVGTSRARFSPDSTILATYGGNDVALLWNLTALDP